MSVQNEVPLSSLFLPPTRLNEQELGWELLFRCMFCSFMRVRSEVVQHEQPGGRDCSTWFALRTVDVYCLPVVLRLNSLSISAGVRILLFCACLGHNCVFANSLFAQTKQSVARRLTLFDITRERERERNIYVYISLCITRCNCVATYTYVYLYIYIYIYIYIFA